MATRTRVCQVLFCETLGPFISRLIARAFWPFSVNDNTWASVLRYLAEEGASMSKSPAIAAIVLAAGRSSRMGTNKLLLPLAGHPLVWHAVSAACASSADTVLVVL